jgi:hypothetical protein
MTRAAGEGDGDGYSPFQAKGHLVHQIMETKKELEASGVNDVSTQNI